MNIKIDIKKPTIDEYNYLYKSVNWGMRSVEQIIEAYKNTLYSVLVYNNKDIVGMGRIIGDKTCFLHIHDVLVIPEFQNKLVGTMIMKELLKEVNIIKEKNDDLRVYLGSSKGIEKFYRKFGFTSRLDNDLGEGMVLM